MFGRKRIYQHVDIDDGDVGEDAFSTFKTLVQLHHYDIHLTIWQLTDVL